MLTDFANSTTFSIFAAFVAGNTLVYIGLTLARVLRWPRPLELARSGDDVDLNDDAGVTTQIQLAVDRNSAETQISRGLLWLGLVACGVAAFEAISVGDRGPEIVATAIGISCLLASLTVRRRRISAVPATWLWAALVAAADTALMVQAGRSGDDFRYAFALVILAGFGTLCFAYRPFLVSALFQIVALAVCLAVWPGDGTLQWVLASGAAFVAGLFMVGQHRQQEEIQRQVMNAVDVSALTDPRTGLLTQRGMRDLGAVIAESRRSGSNDAVLHVVHVDHASMVRASYGPEFLDFLEAEIAELMRGMSSPGDLVGWVRPGSLGLVDWAGAVDAELLRSRIDEMARRVSLGKADTHVTVQNLNMSQHAESPQAWVRFFNGLHSGSSLAP